MAYEEPGVKVVQQLQQTQANVASAAQVTTLVGPLYEVFDDYVHVQAYDALTGAGAQSFTWDGKKTTSVVDLWGVRKSTAESDDQLREYAPYPPVYKLRDPDSGKSFVIDDIDDVFDVDQNGFQIIEGSAAATARAAAATGSASRANRLHVLAGGLVAAGAAVGDRVRVSNGSFDVRGTVSAFGDDDVTYDVDGGEFTLNGAEAAGSTTLEMTLVGAVDPVIPAAGTMMLGDELVTYSGYVLAAGVYTFTVTAVVLDHVAGETASILVSDDVAIAAVDGDMQTTPGNVVSAASTFTTANVGDRVALWVEQIDVYDGVSTGTGKLIQTSSLSIDSAKVGMKVTVHTDAGAESESGADGDLNAVSGQLSSATATFTADMVGNIVKIGSAYRRITAVNQLSGPGVISYDGVALSGTGTAFQVYHPETRTIVAVDANGTDFYVDSDVAVTTGTGLPVVIRRPVYRDIAELVSATEIRYSGAAVSSDTGYLLDVVVDVFADDITYELFPAYELLVSYRALDIDAIDDVVTVYTPTDLTAIGEVVKHNPLLWAAQAALLAMGTDDTPLYLMPVDFYPNDIAGSKSGLPEDQDQVLGYLNALEVLASNAGVYYTVPLTQNSTVRDAFVAHCDAMSVAEIKKERVTGLSYALPMGEIESTTGVIAAGLDAGNKVISDPGKGFVSTYGLIPGKTAVVLTPARWAGEYTVAAGSDDDTLVLEGDNWGQDSLGAYLSTELEYEIADGDTTTANVVLSPAANVWKDVEIGDYVRDAASGAVRRVTNVTSNGVLLYAKLEYEGAAFASGAARTIQILRTDVGVNYYVDPLSKSEQAEALQAISQSRGNRRVVHFWPDVVEMITGTDSQGNDVRELVPSYYAAAAEFGRLSVIPVQRASTGMALAGFTGLDHSNRYFNNSQLNTIAEGGWAILQQATKDAPVVMRHLLTTDMSSVKTQELMFTKNVDNMAKVKRASIEPLLNDDKGRVNITKDFLASLAFPLQGMYERFVANGQLVRTADAEPYKILGIYQDTTAPDGICEDAELNVPLPANRVKVTFIL